jgi:hypothetical protein
VTREKTTCRSQANGSCEGVDGGKVGVPSHWKSMPDGGRDLATVEYLEMDLQAAQFTQIDCNTPARVHERLEMRIALYGDTRAGNCWVTDHEFMSRSQGWDEGVSDRDSDRVTGEGLR